MVVVAGIPPIVNVEVVVADSSTAKDTSLTATVPPEAKDSTIVDSLANVNSLNPGTAKLITSLDSLEWELMQQENKLLRDEVIWLRENQNKVIETTNTVQTPVVQTVVKTDTIFVTKSNDNKVNSLLAKIKQLEDSFANVKKVTPPAKAQTQEWTVFYTNGKVSPPIKWANVLKEVKSKKDQVIRIELAVYTDSGGSASTNLSYATRRAKYLKGELVASGIDANKIEMSPYGEQFANPTVDPKDRKAEISVQFK